MTKLTSQYQLFQKAPRFESGGNTTRKMSFNPYWAFGMAGGAVASLMFRKDTFAAEEVTKTNPWYQVVRDAISKQAYRHSSPDNSHKDLRWDVEKKIIAECKTLSEKHSEPFISQIFEDDEMNMPGVAIVAAYLRQKKAVNNLFVCKSHEAFQQKLEEVSRLEGNVRLALIMADSPEQEEEHDKKDGEYGSDFSHKLAICIEKTGTQMKIAILDPMISKKTMVSPVLVHAPLKTMKYVQLDGLGYALWEIFHSSLDIANTSIYYSSVKRQRNYSGCETFALYDGVAFLNDPHFFEKVQVRKTVLKEDDLQLKLNKIETLPPAFMVGTQSLKQLNEYYEKNETQQDPKAMEELKRKVGKNLIEVDGTLQNHYNEQKSIKHHLLTLAALELLSTTELQQIIRDPLLTVSRLPLTEGQAPKTLSDLHYYNPIVVTEQV
ncbi:MAG TPA: hypothetical protein VIJ14_04625 [Rhabdochlamydiaceae bacterium]